MNRTTGLAIAAMGSLAILAAHAGGVAPPVQTSSQTDTKAYVGLNWTVGGGVTPALVLGVMNAKVKSNGDTSGAKLALHVNLAGGINPGKLKLSYLNGKENAQGELGLGYDFSKGAPLGFLGLNAPHAALGVDGYLSHGFAPFFTLHSQGGFDKPAAAPAAPAMMAVSR